jgi:hypothetical protein
LHIPEHDPPSEQEIYKLLDDKQPKISLSDASKIFDIFADLSVQNVKSSFAAGAILKGEWEVANPGIVDFLRNAEVVYEKIVALAPDC